jgi:hypothetical protein
MSEVTSQRSAPPVANPKNRMRSDLADRTCFLNSHEAAV